MIHAVLFRRGERLNGFSVSGHAGYADEGSDIVCAAVSILTCTCVNSLESIAHVVPEVNGGEDGFLEAWLPEITDQQTERDAQVLLGALRQGLSDLAQAYPRNIRLSFRNGGRTS